MMTREDARQLFAWIVVLGLVLAGSIGTPALFPQTQVSR